MLHCLTLLFIESHHIQLRNYTLNCMASLCITLNYIKVYSITLDNIVLHPLHFEITVHDIMSHWHCRGLITVCRWYGVEARGPSRSDRSDPDGSSTGWQCQVHNDGWQALLAQGQGRQLLARRMQGGVAAHIHQGMHHLLKSTCQILYGVNIINIINITIIVTAKFLRCP